MTTTTDWTESLDKLGACPDAMEWARGYGSLADAWAACERGDWMLWLAGRSDAYGTAWSDERQPLGRAACACARLALPCAKDPRVLACIETTERWCNGEATQDEVRDARAAANAAANAANAAAYAAANAANAASYAAAYAAANAAVAANAANAVANAADAANATAVNAAVAAHAACNANAAANAANAAYAANAAAYTANAANASCNAAMKATLKQCADIVRAMLPCPEVSR